MVINSENNSIDFSMDSKHMFSEIDQEVTLGKINVKTTAKTKKEYVVHMSLRYTNYDITYKGEERERELQQSSTPYKIIINNAGKAASGDKTAINFDVS